jgi:hypothetical protein
MPDVYAEIPKALRELGKVSEEISDAITSISQKVRKFRTDMQQADRSEEVLKQVQDVNTALVEANRALAAAEAKLP